MAMPKFVASAEPENCGAGAVVRETSSNAAGIRWIERVRKNVVHLELARPLFNELDANQTAKR
jgi:hypothetical protein